MPAKGPSRSIIIVLIFMLYFLPLSLFSVFNMTTSSLNQSWQIFSLGLLCSVGGSILIYVLLYRWENEILQPTSLEVATLPIPSTASQEALKAAEENANKLIHTLEESHREELNQRDSKIVLITTQLHQQDEEIKRITAEFSWQQQKLDQLNEELENQKKSSQEQAEHKELLLAKHNQTIIELQSAFEKKQQQNVQLENKIRDLNYEIKTLLHLANIDLPTESSSTETNSLQIQEQRPLQKIESIDESRENADHSEKLVHNPQEAVIQLRRCIDIAQKITSALHYGASTSRLRDLHIDSYALDLRRLFDSLRSENNCTVLVYSQKESKLLFVNDQIKYLLGWSPEKFVQNFSDIIQHSRDNWADGLTQLAAKNESKMSLLMKSRNGQEVLIQCQLGNVPSGIFRNHVIGVLYTTSHSL